MIKIGNRFSASDLVRASCAVCAKAHLAHGILSSIYQRSSKDLFDMSEVLLPREAGKLIAGTSKDVTIQREGVESIAKLIINQARSGKFGVNTWNNHDLNPKTADKAAIDLEGLAITDPNYYASMSLEDLKKLFRSDSDSEIPMIEERHKAITEAGKILLKEYQGSFVNCIKMCDGSAQKLLRLVVRDFPSFRDEAEYNGKKVGLYKRAQILIADIWAACGEKGIGEFNDIDTITMFPDYRIPQVLAYYGALKFSDRLKSQLEKDNLLENGCRLEVEIRGCSIWATELIVEEVKKMAAIDPDPDIKVTPCNQIRVDYFLWEHRRECENVMESTPFHKTRSIYY